MIAVLFEVEPAPGMTQPYLHLATQMRALVGTVPGFISVERFQSLTNPGKLLSRSCWENETALTAWRQTPEHRAAQRSGRHASFAGYRLRVVAANRSDGRDDRDRAPTDSRALPG